MNTGGANAHPGLVAPAEATLLGRAGGDAGPTTRGIWRRRCRSPRSRGCSPCCARSSIRPSGRGARPVRSSRRRVGREVPRGPRSTSMPPERTCWRSPCSRARSTDVAGIFPTDPPSSGWPVGLQRGSRRPAPRGPDVVLRSGHSPTAAGPLSPRWCVHPAVTDSGSTVCGGHTRSGRSSRPPARGR